MHERFDPRLREINEQKFKKDAEDQSEKLSFLRRILNLNNKDPRGPAEDEARVWNEWRNIDEKEAASPLNELAREDGVEVYRPYIVDNPEAVEAYADHDPRWRFGFALAYGLTRMFGAVPGEETLPRRLGGMMFPGTTGFPGFQGCSR